MTTTTPTPAPAPMTAGRLDQCAWLIECRIGPESTYIQLKSREELSQEWEEEIHARGYDAAKKLKPWHFTKDASSATRFAREEDAARAMVALGMQGPTGLLDWLRPTEHMWSDAAHPDVSNVPALTARVAELEGHVDDMSMKLTEAQHRCEAAEAELAAARKVEDGEVERFINGLRELALSHGEFSATEELAYGQAADLLTRLSDALKEAEAKLETIRLALFPDPEHHITHHARYNLEGALADLEAGQNDPTVRRTLQRVAGQIAAAEHALQTKDTTP